jgi:outer membrane protein assembly factor BamB
MRSPVSPTGNWGTPAYFRGQIYIQGVGDPLKQFDASQSLLSAGPLAISNNVVGYTGTTPAVSSNGLLNGIIWTSEVSGSASKKPLVLHAYDAANVSHELYNSAMSRKRDTAGPAVKFGVPTVANGKVYVGTQSELDVYGLLP